MALSTVRDHVLQGLAVVVLGATGTTVANNWHTNGQQDIKIEKVEQNETAVLHELKGIRASIGELQTDVAILIDRDKQKDRP